MNRDNRQSLSQDSLILVLLQLKSVHYEDTFLDLHVHFVYNATPFLQKVKLSFDSAHIMRNRLFASIRENISKGGLNLLPPGVNLQWENMAVYKENALKYFSELMREVNLNKKRTGSRFIMSKDLPIVTDADLDELSINKERLALELVLAKGKMDQQAWSPIVIRLQPFIEKYPNDVELQLIYGQCKYALRDRDTGTMMLRKAGLNSEIDPERLMEVSFWLYKNRDKDLAIELLEAPLSNDKSKIFSRYLLAQIHYGFREAEYLPLLQKLRDENPLLFSHYLDQAWDFSLKINSMESLELDEISKLLPAMEKSEIEKLAYKGEIPSEYDVDTDELTFYKEEVEAWLEFQKNFPGKIDSAMD